MTLKRGFRASNLIPSCIHFVPSGGSFSQHKTAGVTSVSNPVTHSHSKDSSAGLPTTFPAHHSLPLYSSLSKQAVSSARNSGMPACLPLQRPGMSLQSPCTQEDSLPPTTPGGAMLPLCLLLPGSASNKALFSLFLILLCLLD